MNKMKSFYSLKNILLVLLNVSLLFYSCNQDDVIELKPTLLYADETIDEINDSVFITEFQDIKHNNKLLFFSDIQNHRVICTDMDLQLKGVLGQPGKGPGDLISPCGIIIDNDELWVYSIGTGVINQYDINSYEFLNKISFKEQMYPTNYLLLDNILISSMGRHESPIRFFNRNGELLGNIGTNKHELPLNIGRLRNFIFESLENHDSFLAICVSEPIIEMYSTSGDLILQYDYSSIKIIDELIKFDTNKKANEISHNVVYGCLEDSYYTEGKLYLLVYSRDKNNKKKSNILLTFKVSENKIVPDKKIILNPNNQTWYTSFIVTSNSIIAYDHMNFTLDRFSWSKN